jgi:hypothetical protein
LFGGRPSLSKEEKNSAEAFKTLNNAEAFKTLNNNNVATPGC